MKHNNIINFYRQIYHDNRYRIIGRRNLLKDIILYCRNKLLRPVERRLIRRYYSRNYPLVFIVAPPRAGTTLLSQFIVDHFDLVYITNYMSRYWMCPLYAATRQNHSISSARSMKYESFLGNTTGDTAPHEFGYFWQYWMDHGDTDELTPEEMARINWNVIERELFGLTGYFKKPLLIKSVNFIDYKIPAVLDNLPGSHFIRIIRDPVFAIQSIYEARLKRYGNPIVWWSIRPRAMQEMQKKDPVEQVTHQFFAIEEAISRGLEAIPANLHCTVTYKELVENPAAVGATLSQFLKEPLLRPVSGAEQPELPNRNFKRLDDKLFKRIEETVHGYHRHGDQHRSDRRA